MLTNELKGLITQAVIGGDLSWTDEINITCCRKVPRIKIGEVDVYNLLDAEMEALESLEDKPSDAPDEADDSKEWRVRYIVQPEPFPENANFEDHAARVQLARIYSEVDRGCYSEWTCGVGGFDFMIDGKGHSLLTELASYVGQYVWLKFT